MEKHYLDIYSITWVTVCDYAQISYILVKDFLMKPLFTRRNFMVGCSTAIAAMAGGRLNYVAFGNAEEEPHQDILVVVFLRGGCDGLNIVPVLDGPDRGIYERNRERTAVPLTGDNAALLLDDRFGLHPAAAPLYELFQDEKLAIVHAVGLTSDTRSHFDAMQYMELGTPGSKASTSGWLSRHLATIDGFSEDGITDDILVPALAVGNQSPTSLSGNSLAIGMTQPRDFTFGGNWQYANWQRQALRNMYQGATPIHESGLRTLDAIDIIESHAPDAYRPARGIEYPSTSFGRNMQSIAQMVKMQLGMRVATIDLGGWDTHEYQGAAGGGYFASLLGELAQGMHALYADLVGVGGSRNAQRVTMVVMSEFGRSLKENGSRGTDHGHGNVMLVLGNQVNGGKIYGDWPTLETGALYDGRDLAITTDYRRVLSEILIRRLKNPNIGTIFPNYDGYSPLDIVTGEDLPIVNDNSSNL
ncbi:MAG: DUF1501 domain-containing protein [Chloroflexota bacterium]